jgi:hypothetical protein
MILVFSVLAIIGGVSVDLFVTYLRTLNFEHSRAEISLNLMENFENDVVRKLRLANQVQVSGTLKDRVDYHDGLSNIYYALYFYNSKDSAFGTYDQPTYSLMRATTVSLGSALPSYGSGDVIMTELLPPPSFYVLTPTTGQPGVVLNLTATRGGETYQIRQEICPRNP